MVYNLKELTINNVKRQVNQFESNIEPFLRYIHEAAIAPSGWVKIPKGSYDLNYKGIFSTTSTIDVVAQCTNMKRHNESNPAPFLIASYDIECTSSHGDFPMAVKTYKKTARELNDYYRSIVTSKKKISTKSETEDLLKTALYGLFGIGDTKESCLTYVIHKNRAKVDKDEIKKSIDNCIGDIIKIYKDKPFSENKISEYLKKDLKLEDPKKIIKDLRDLHEVLCKKKAHFLEIERVLIGTLKRRIEQNTNADQHASILIKKVETNSKIIMSLFDQDTMYDKVAKKFKLMGFPELEGDKIIQIGTTFHVYGETQCFYKNIITLKDVEDNFDVDEIVECSNEKQLLVEWKNMILRMDPDVLTGYNIFGFDNGYIRDRSIELNCYQTVERLGRLKYIDYTERNPSFIVKELQSSALGQNILKYYSAEGRVQIDIMKLVQKDFKLDTYKLDNVATHFINGKITRVFDNKTIEIDSTQGLNENNFLKLGTKKFKILKISGNTITICNEAGEDIRNAKSWGMVKDDISPNEIFEAQSKGPRERALIAKYCLQDCALCNYLMMKLEILANNTGMSNVCLVPLSYIFLRGQGVKIFSLVAKQCLEDGFIIPVTRRVEDTEDSYEGAIVLDPEIGIYEEPISVLDFASLYPSSMISENISHDSIVLDEKYDNLPGIEYLNIKYDVNGRENIVRFAQFESGEKGILPRILMKLLSQRKLTRKKIAYKTVETQDRSFTGIATYADDSVKIKDLDTSDEFTIDKQAIKEVYDTYNDFEKAVLDGLQLAYKITANSLYGQVGAKTSPIYLQELAASTTATGRNLVIKLKDFAEENFDCKVVYGDSVTPDTPILIRQGGTIKTCRIDSLVESYEERDDGKEIANINAEVWTEEGFTAIHQIVRHKTRKKIHRVLTQTGVVDVTEDHSLLLDTKEIIKPCEVNLGTELLHGDCERAFQNASNLEGCRAVAIDAARVYGFIFNSNFNEPQPLKKGEIPDLNWKVKELAHSAICRNKHKEKVVHSCILNAPVEVMRAFLEGYLPKDANNFTRLDINIQGKEGSMGMFILGRRLGYNVSINTLRDEPNVFRQTWTTSPQKKDPIAIKKIEIVGETEGYVYDLTTESHHFHVGPGDLVVHNTDSIFLKFNKLEDQNGNELTGKERLQASIDKSIELSKAFKPELKVPHDAEYEKTFWPFIIMSKKRYVGNLYEEDVNKFKQKSMGIVLKRRDNANILKKVYGGMIDIILNKNDISESIIFLRNTLKNIEEGKVVMDDLIITKTLRGSYADPSRISHKVLADRMMERDPGSAPQVNDRVPYVYVVNKDKKALQGDRIEHPDFVEKNKIKIDYAFYITNQILKPVSQLLSLRVEELPGFKKAKNHYGKLYDKYVSEFGHSKAMDKVNNMKEIEVTKLIFDPVLCSIKRRQSSQTCISDFF